MSNSYLIAAGVITIATLCFQYYVWNKTDKIGFKIENQFLVRS